MSKRGKYCFTFWLFLSEQAGLNGVETIPSQREVAEAIELQNTPLSPREMFRLSQRIAVHWDRLAGLVGVTRAVRDDIRYSNGGYYDNCARAEKILSIINSRRNFLREDLACCLREIGQNEWIEPILSGNWRGLWPSCHL